MSLVVGTNTSAQFAQDALRANQNKIATAMQRLSTGLRINSARDDAAGLAISQSMTSQIRGLNQAVRNINDGINLLQTAEGGLGSITDMLQRMRELAVQSANGTNSGAQRAYLQKEAAALQEQIGKIADTTTWNDKKLLDGSFTGQKIQVGAASGATMELTIEVPTVAAGFNSTVTTTTSVTTVSPTQLSGGTMGTSALASGELQINNVSIGAALSASAKDVAAAINLQSSTTGVSAMARSTVSTPSNFIGTVAATIPLGTYYDGVTRGKLIFPVQSSDGNWYYYWDRSGNGSTSGDDNSDVGTFIPAWISWKDVNGNSGALSETNRFTSINETQLALPTLSKLRELVYQSMGGGGTSNAAGWIDGAFVSSTTRASSSYNGFQAINGFGQINNFGYGNHSTMDKIYSAFQVLNPPSSFPQISSDGIRINGINIGAIATAVTNTERSAQMRTAINAQSAITGVLASTDPGTGGLILTAVDGRNIEISTLTAAAISSNGTGLALTGVPSGNRTVTTFRTGIDLNSNSSTGIVVIASASGATATGLNSGTTAPTINTVTTTTTTTTPSIDIITASGASSAIGVIDGTLDSVNSARSTIGSYINRLNYAGDNATNISSNLSASRSTIMDTDYAEESANLAKSQIIQQAATAMLAQANQQPQSVLALLKNL